MEQASPTKLGRFIPRHDPSSENLRTPSDATNVVLLFGGLRAHPARRQLFADSQPVEIGGRAFDLLMVLAAAPRTLISKPEIFATVWPNLHVEDANLRVQVAALRKALGKDRDLLETVPGRGYSLSATVEVEGAVAAESAAELKPGGPEPLEVRKTNLIARPHGMVGRQAELVALENALDRSRLITLTGAGGIGKTRLAVELGQRFAGRWPDGVWLIDVAPINQDSVLKAATAAVLGVTFREEGTATDAIAIAISNRQMLLIFDNCELLIGPVAALV
jgi:DNA-binding winged helix-turn-helix (wHTH) protein